MPANECMFPDGSAITFDNGFAGIVQQIGEPLQRSVPVGDCTPLSQGLNSGKPTARKKVPGRTYDHEQVEVAVFFHPEHGLPPIGEIGNECTITYPSDESTKTLNGGCFINSDSLGALVPGELSMMRMTFVWEGGAGVGDNPPDLS